MTEFLITHYETLRALHLIAVISWMAGLLYLPRLFVYHCGVATGSEASETFKVMERKLLRIIMNPAMTASWLFGLLLLVARWDMFMAAGWMHLKITAVMGLTAVHMIYAGWRRDFEADRNTRPGTFYRWWNEAPTVLMILIVVLAVVEPF